MKFVDLVYLYCVKLPTSAVMSPAKTYRAVLW